MEVLGLVMEGSFVPILNDAGFPNSVLVLGWFVRVKLDMYHVVPNCQYSTMCDSTGRHM